MMMHSSFHVCRLLTSTVTPCLVTSLDERRIICHLFTLGEIAQLCPDKTPKRVYMLVQSLISTPVITSLGA